MHLSRIIFLISGRPRAQNYMCLYTHSMTYYIMTGAYITVYQWCGSQISRSKVLWLYLRSIPIYPSPYTSITDSSKTLIFFFPIEIFSLKNFYYSIVLVLLSELYTLFALNERRNYHIIYDSVLFAHSILCVELGWNCSR